MLGPGDSVDSVTLGYAPTATISADTTTSATWTAYQSGPSNVNTAMDSIDITVVPPLELQKTVGLSRHMRDQIDRHRHAGNRVLLLHRHQQLLYDAYRPRSR